MVLSTFVDTLCVRLVGLSTLVALRAFDWLSCPLLRTLACYGFVHFSGRLRMLAYYVLFILAGTAVFAVPPCGRYMEIFVKKP